jgi:hypothetical protein
VKTGKTPNAGAHDSVENREHNRGGELANQRVEKPLAYCVVHFNPSV